MNERIGLIAVHGIDGVGWHTIDRMTASGWSPGDGVTPGLLADLARLGVPERTVESLRRSWSPSLPAETEEKLKAQGIDTVTVLDGGRYPERLREIAQPPWVLYVKGDASLLAEPSIAVVGTRRPTHYGLKACGWLVRELAAAGLTVVSGMASGIDGEAHRITLEAGGHTVAVLGCGVDVVYPKQHRKLYDQLIRCGAVISESPPGTEPLRGLFPRRNRIISGLSLGTLVVEAAERSGSLITADFSMEQGREVFAVPGPVTSAQSRGTLRLIQQGAKCVMGPEDIFEELKWILPETAASKLPENTAVQLTERERLLLGHLGEEPVHVADWIARLGGKVPVGEFHRLVLELEMKRVIGRLPCGRYVRKHPG